MADLTEEFRDGFPFLGGRLWLDLLNTELVRNGTPEDLIASPGRAADWARAAAPGEAAAPGDLPALRSALRAALPALRSGAPLPAETVQAVNAALGDLAIRLSLTETRQLRERRETGPAGFSARVAEDFARFVADHEPGRLRSCDGPGCVVTFYDTGRNNTRRWCSMSLCGNRDKVARYRARRAT